MVVKMVVKMVEVAKIFEIAKMYKLAIDKMTFSIRSNGIYSTNKID